MKILIYMNRYRLDKMIKIRYNIINKRGGGGMKMIETLETLKREYGVLSGYCWDFEEGIEGVKVLDFEVLGEASFKIVAQGCQSGKTWELWGDYLGLGDFVINLADIEGGEE